MIRRRKVNSAVTNNTSFEDSQLGVCIAENVLLQILFSLTFSTVEIAESIVIDDYDFFTVPWGGSLRGR
jgi:hypothetical protein